ncbi:GIN domain-containing protein [Allosphingosinicella indica]|uniref:Putative auto-transporter adhesin, head GIN domain n=1 Tax=Allosphingosinicella indica TaxID=941907 RepID=A0A1X7G3L2_9SPHN|nr:DUF2807 domain-containing protein [Allosphingosinicella indica]SMF63291.1 Putative auto-transporter adhesin, head GIN domain [Allosphingosinicella indica]
MNRIPVALLFAALAPAPAAAAERRFTVTDFDRVQIDGPFEVRLVTGKPNGAIARGDTRALDSVSIEVQGKLLKVKPSLSRWGGYPGEATGTPVIELSTRDLASVFVRGTGSLSVDSVKAMKFEASLSGSGAIAIGRIEADRLDLALLGSGGITIAGKAKTLRASIQGQGDLAAEGLVSEDAQINAGTTGRVMTTVNRAVKVNSAGSGDVEIAGKAACTVTVRGSGRVMCGR